MNYIYGYLNKISNKWYVGQTTLPIKERHRLHLSGAKNKNSSDYNCLFHKKIREYGIENFELFILEEVPNKEDLDKKEQFWIKQKNSFVKYGQGYNITTGGQKRKVNEDYWDIRCCLSKEEALNIIRLLQETDIPQTEIAKQYNINIGIVNQINSGKKYRLLEENQYPIREKKILPLSTETVEVIIALLQQGYGNAEIAKMFNGEVKPGTISAINIGDKHKSPKYSYPIRKKTNEKIKKQEQAEKIKYLLEEGKLNNKQISEIIGCDPSIVSRINYGKTYKDENRKYPIRN